MEKLSDRKAFSKNVMLSEGVVVLEGTATWCGQCKAIAPFVEKLIKKYPEAKFYEFDVEAAPDIAQELGISLMPTFNIFKDGDQMENVTGAKGKELDQKIGKTYTGTVVDVEL